MTKQVFPQGSRFLIIVSIRTESLNNINPILAQKVPGDMTRDSKEDNHDNDKDKPNGPSTRRILPPPPSFVFQAEKITKKSSLIL